MLADRAQAVTAAPSAAELGQLAFHWYRAGDWPRANRSARHLIERRRCAHHPSRQHPAVQSA